jgi:hypothetical protein
MKNELVPTMLQNARNGVKGKLILAQGAKQTSSAERNNRRQFQIGSRNHDARYLSERLVRKAQLLPKLVNGRFDTSTEGRQSAR